MSEFHKIVCAALIIIGLTGAAGPAGEKRSGTLQDLSWLAGAWRERKGAVETEEQWMAPKGDLMLGMNRATREKGATSFEFLRITRTGNKIVYLASPDGRGWTEFPMVKSESRKVVFENLANPFPQRIVYWLDSDGALRARIEGTIQGKERSKDWRWEKVKGSE